MDYREFINRVSFRLIQPHARLRLSEDFYERRMVALNATGRPGFPERFGTAFEMFNTRFPEDGRALKRRLRAVCLLPRMSTLAVGAIINRGVADMADDGMFVNVGVWHGFSFLAGLAGNGRKRCVGVDNFSEFGGPRDFFLKNFERFRSSRHTFHDMDYEDYFASEHRGKIGFYIYDGDHAYEHQLKGLEAAEPHFSEQCVILVDDTNWDAPRRAVVDFIEARPNRYEILLDRTTAGNCHPTFWNGLMVFRRIG